MAEQKAGPRAFTTTNGMTVSLQAVPAVLVSAAQRRVAKHMREAGEPIDPPTYTVTTAAGTEEVHQHDVKSLEVLPQQTGLADPEAAAAEAERRTTANQRAWAAHMLAKARLEERQGKATSRVLIEEGITLAMPADDGWLARQRKYDVEIPEDPADLRYHWLTTEVLVTPDDLMNAVQGISALSYAGAMTQEDIDAMGATFRRRVERAAARLVRDSRRAALELQYDLPGDPDSQSVGPDAGAVQEPAVPGPGGDDGGGADAGADD